MYEKLGPHPGTFPHIFVDGVHQWNNSWTALTRTLCGHLSPAPPACAVRAAGVTFHLATNWNVSSASIQRRAQPFADAVLEACNLAASRRLFPWHWNTTGEAGQRPGAASYVDVCAASSATLASLTPLPMPTPMPTVAVVVGFEALAALEPPLLNALSRAAQDAAAPLLAGTLRAHGFEVGDGSISSIRTKGA